MKNSLFKKTYNFVIYSLLFLIGFHFFNLSGYFLLALFVICLFKAIACREIRFSSSFLLTILLSITFSIFAYFSFEHSLKTFVYYCCGPICFFLLGQGNQFESPKAKFLPLFFFAFGLLFLNLFNIFYTATYTGFFQEFRVYYYVWTPGSTKSATFFSISSIPVTGLSIGLFFSGKKEGKQWWLYLLSILGIISSFYFSICLANRSFFVVFLLCIFAAICIRFYKNKNFTIIFLTIIGSSIFIYFLVLIFVSNNILNFRNLVIKIPILYRFFSGGSDNSRINIYISFFKNFIQYPFGGLCSSGLLNNGVTSTQFVHNVWLDVYSVGGFLPCICFLLLTVASFFNSLCILKNKPDFYSISLVISFLGILLLFLFEPVFQSDPYIFSIVFLFFGFFESSASEKIHLSQKIKKLKMDEIKVAYISNFVSIHVSDLHKELVGKFGSRYTFISCTPVSTDHAFYSSGAQYTNVFNMFGSKNAITEGKSILDKADVIICDTAPWKYINRHRLNRNKIIIRASERFFKKSKFEYLHPRAIVSQIIHLRPYDYCNEIILCMSAYTPIDAVLAGFSPNKLLKWGYFPGAKIVSPQITTNKVFRIAFVNRLIPLKHPEHVIELASTLKEKGYDFEVLFCGEGDPAYVDSLKKKVLDYGLYNNVFFLGKVNNLEIEKILLSSDVLLSCSDQSEGWGATVNEGLSHGCAVVASYYVGAAVSLIKNGINGFIYDFNNLMDLIGKIENLILNPDLLLKIKQNAYLSYTQEYSPSVVADRLYTFLEYVIKTGRLDCFGDGILSKALVFDEEAVVSSIKEDNI